MITALVLSGETNAEDLPGAEFQPDILAPSIVEITAMLKKALED
jgi:ribonucleotide monophosphatase NagD (HAD superfamily)